MAIDFSALDACLKSRFPRAYPWLWFVGLYGASLLAISVFAYGLRWMIKG